MHTHVKDAIFGPGKYGEGADDLYILPPIGKGDMPWKDYIQALVEIKYDGWLIVEYGGKQPFKKGMIESKKSLEKYLREANIHY